MPRRNRTPKQSKFTPANAESGKIRYASKAAANKQIQEIQRYNPELLLTAYQSHRDGGWYLTSR